MQNRKSASIEQSEMRFAILSVFTKSIFLFAKSINESVVCKEGGG
ncbi:hypothetical protein [Helicobacter sp. MIT 05-5294]|nr:hypothetical protein [Helicobacter sp. MIT 05-5294]